MKYLIIILIAMLTGCALQTSQRLTTSPIEIENTELSNYWEHEVDSFKLEFISTGPRMPGFVEVKYLIDSNGDVFNATVVKSQPKGVWDKAAIKAISNLKYRNVKQNPEATPVYVSMEISFDG